MISQDKNRQATLSFWNLTSLLTWILNYLVRMECFFVSFISITVGCCSFESNWMHKSGATHCLIQTKFPFFFGTSNNFSTILNLDFTLPPYSSLDFSDPFHLFYPFNLQIYSWPFFSNLLQ